MVKLKVQSHKFSHHQLVEFETLKQKMLVERKQTQKESELLLIINVAMNLVN